jgi:hypothetical protein
MTDYIDPTTTRTDSTADFVAQTSAAALGATLDYEAAPRAGDPLPHLWRWIFFRPVVRQSQIATDGHPAKGDFLPDLGLPRRMWAGGRLRFHAPLTVGSSITRDSTIVNVSEKECRSGKPRSSRSSTRYASMALWRFTRSKTSSTENPRFKASPLRRQRQRHQTNFGTRKSCQRKYCCSATRLLLSSDTAFTTISLTLPKSRAIRISSSMARSSRHC